MHNDTRTLQRILRDYRTIAVVGISTDASRPSFYVSQYMQDHGFRIIPVNPRYAPQGTTILGSRCLASLADITEPVDIVNVFRRTEEVLPVAEQAVAMGAKCLWQQLGIGNLQADALARQAGMDSVYDRCIKVEHARLMGG